MRADISYSTFEPQETDTNAAEPFEVHHHVAHLSFGSPRFRSAAMGSNDDARSTDLLVACAMEEVKRRRARIKYLPADLFGEGAWMILLDLFISEHKGRSVSTTSACLAADVPETTALRWLDALENKDLIRRTPTPRDRRVKLVSLTTEGHVAVRGALSCHKL